MRVPLIGMGVAAVLVCSWLAILRYPPSQRMGFVIYLFIAFWFIMVGGTLLLRKLHRETWQFASAQILSCSMVYNGHQGPDCICSYLYEVDGARQGGSFLIHHPNASLDQLNKGLVGKTVDIRYNPADCTDSMIDANSINGWRVQ